MLRFGTAERRGAVHIPHIRAYLFGALRLATPAYTKGANISAWGGVCEMRHCERQRMNQGGEKGGEGAETFALSRPYVYRHLRLAEAASA